MPIVDVEMISRDVEAVEVGLAQRIADAFGEIFESPPRRTWVRLRRLDYRDYAENGVTHPTDRPVFVSVLKRHAPPLDARRIEVRRLTESLAAILDRPMENVHIIYGPDGAGRVAFGGVLVEP